MINIDAEGRAIKKALVSMLAKARKTGVKQPTIYFESEGWVYVMDRGVSEGHSDDASSATRQQAVIASVFVGGFDVGAW